MAKDIKKEIEVISSFLDGEENSLIKPKFTLVSEKSILTLYGTQIAQKEGDIIYLMNEAQKKDMNGRNIDPETTNDVIQHVINQIRKKKSLVLKRVPFNFEYSGDLKDLLPHRNVIISGTPGSGKSYFVKNYAIPEILFTAPVPKNQSEEEKFCQSHTTRVTFTEGYTREDFFGCYKPVAVKSDKAAESDKQSITYDFVPGPFCRAVCSALCNPEENHILVIEELNRGNVYEILGDIFQLLDREEDGRSSFPIALSEDAGKWFKKKLIDLSSSFDPDHFRLPDNLYIICTMNNSDARVQFLDTAFKRRFSSAYMDEEGYLYAADNIPGARSYSETNESDAAKKHEAYNKLITREEYDKIRIWINKELQSNDNSQDSLITEDKLIAAHFVRFERDKNGNEGIRQIEFVTNVLGYLLQNVFRGREQTSQFGEIFNEKCPHTLGLLLKEYSEKCTEDADDLVALKEILRYWEKQQPGYTANEHRKD